MNKIRPTTTWTTRSNPPTSELLVAVATSNPGCAWSAKGGGSDADVIVVVDVKSADRSILIDAVGVNGPMPCRLYAATLKEYLDVDEMLKRTSDVTSGSRVKLENSVPVDSLLRDSTST